MSIDKNLLRERLTEVIAHRIEWNGDDEFDWEGAYSGTAFAGEGENTITFPEEGQFSIEIPLSILGSPENDAVAYVNVSVQVTEVDALYE